MASLNYKTEDGWKKVAGGKTGVLTFKGRAGVVSPAEGDYTAEMVGARPDTWMPNIAEVGGVNPNLLDNWYFANPVNQRGQTEYTASGYMHDRWYGINGGTLTGEGYKPMLNIGNRIIQQPLEDTLAADIKGKTVTLSVLLKNGGLLSVTGTSPFAKIIGNVNLSIAEKVWPQSDRTVFRIWMTSHTDDDTIIAAKLELGSNQTLAHQDADGNWVLNEIPDYGAELRKCQRYQIFLGQYERYNAVDLKADYIDFTISLPVTLRAHPEIVNPDKIELYSRDGASQSGFSFSVAVLGTTSIGLRAAKPAHGLSDAYVGFTTNEVGFDANL